MSEVMLTLRDEERSIHNCVHGNEAERLIAAVSADPESIGELAHAVLRFQATDGKRDPFSSWMSGDCDEPYDAGVYIVDLAARLIVGESSYFTPAHNGWVLFHDGTCVTDLTARYHIADHWRITEPLDDWLSLATQRREQFAVTRHYDTRKVLYETFCRYAVEQCLQHRERSSDNSIAAIHRKWLMTPRTDLGDRSPRDVLFADRDHLEADLQDRAAQWTRAGACPPCISETAAAYRRGGFGIHEWAMYYDFARFVLGECWSSALNHPQLRAAEEANRLEREAETWFHTRLPDMDNLTPFQIIDRERRRIPLTVPAGESLTDDDCPLCKMMLESSGPCFIHLDGSHMDDDFAFSRYDALEDWEEGHREYASANRHREKERQP